LRKQALTKELSFEENISTFGYDASGRYLLAVCSNIHLLEVKKFKEIATIKGSEFESHTLKYNTANL